MECSEASLLKSKFSSHLYHNLKSQVLVDLHRNLIFEYGIMLLHLTLVLITRSPHEARWAACSSCPCFFPLFLAPHPTPFCLFSIFSPQCYFLCWTDQLFHRMPATLVRIPRAASSCPTEEAQPIAIASFRWWAPCFPLCTDWTSSSWICSRRSAAFVVGEESARRT